VVAAVKALGAQVVVASKKRRKIALLDYELCRDCHKVERFSSLFKQFRRLATHYEKTASGFP
jgi:transposase